MPRASPAPGVLPRCWAPVEAPSANSAQLSPSFSPRPAPLKPGHIEMTLACSLACSPSCLLACCLALACYGFDRYRVTPRRAACPCPDVGRCILLPNSSPLERSDFPLQKCPPQVATSPGRVAAWNIFTEATCTTWPHSCALQLRVFEHVCSSTSC